jgi:hypothetical protein
MEVPRRVRSARVSAHRGGGRLASPQYEALLAAFGRLGGPPLDLFLLALATLELLAWTAKGAGLLVVIDDLQWIDDASRQVLGFVARRLASEPVALLATTRPGFEDPLSGTGVPVRMLRPLSRAEAERLVLRRHPDLDERRRAWVLGHAEGNPLALTELPLTATDGKPSLPARVPLTARLERSFVARLAGLSVPTQTAAVVAAASDGDNFAEIAAAVALAVPGSDPDALCPAIDAGILKDTLDRSVPGDPLRVRALTEPTAELIDAGEDDLAFRLLLAAAVHVWSAHPGPEARASLAAAAGRLPFPEGDSRLLAIGGFTAPARYGDQIARRVAALHPAELDPVSAELALSVCLVGAGEAVTAVQRAVADRARREGRRAALPRLLTRQAWNAIALADWTAAVPAAAEAVQLAEELRQPPWQAAALCAQAMITGMRGAVRPRRSLLPEGAQPLGPRRLRGGGRAHRTDRRGQENPR